MGMNEKELKIVVLMSERGSFFNDEQTNTSFQEFMILIVLRGERVLTQSSNLILLRAKFHNSDISNTKSQTCMF